LQACQIVAPPMMQALYALYEVRTAAFEAAPPPSDWDGVFTATTK